MGADNGAGGEEEEADRAGRDGDEAPEEATNRQWGSLPAAPLGVFRVVPWGGRFRGPQY